MRVFERTWETLGCLLWRLYNLRMSSKLSEVSLFASLILYHTTLYRNIVVSWVLLCVCMLQNFINIIKEILIETFCVS